MKDAQIEKLYMALEEMGKLQGIITTNEDCIHTIAGSQNVAELEGGYQVNTCERCGYRNYDYEIWNQGHMPKCPECGGMMLPYDLYSRAGLWEPAVRKAQEWIGQADLILVVGTNGYYGSVYWNRRKRSAGIIYSTGKDKNGKSVSRQYEVDFVCNLGSCRYYIQSAWSMPDETKRSQEERALRRVNDSFKKIIITHDVVSAQYDESRILTMNIFDFLLNSSSLEATT